LPDLFTDALNLETVSGDRDTAIADVAKLPLKPAGVEAVYNQTGYMLLGMIIEKISGTSYENFVRDRVLSPAGMKNASKKASWGDGWALIPGLATLYTKVDVTPDHTKLLVRDGRPVLTDKVLRYGSYHLPEYLAPAGYVNGSLHDLVNWEITLSQGKLLKPAALAEMVKPYKLANGKDGIFALAYVSVPMNLFDTSTAKFGPYTTVSYGGGSATFRMSIPEKHLTVIVLTNLEGASPQYLSADIATLYEPSLLAPATH
jgi:CubicO group peptidase (beta-lactamase class C family)